MKFLELVLMKKLHPICEVGVKFYAHVLGSFRRELCLAGFTQAEANSVVLTLLDSKRKK